LSSEPETSAAPDSPVPDTPVPNPSDVPARKRWQFSIRVIFLVMAAIGVWMAVVVNRRAIPPLQRRVDSIRPLLARELQVKDESQIAIVDSEETWYDDNEWQVYLPSSGYQLSLATQQIDHQNTPPAGKTAPLPTGRFRLALTQERHDGGWRVMVTKDGKELLKIDEPLTLEPDRLTIGGTHFTTSRQFKPSETVVLFRRPFSPSKRITRGPTIGRQSLKPREGVMLWIEPIAPPK
jgi:hypothetical protein